MSTKPIFSALVFLVICLTLLPLTGWATPVMVPALQDLSTGWQVRAGDSPQAMLAEASPDDWTAVEELSGGEFPPAARQDHPEVEAVWYRRTLQVPTIGQTPLALALGPTTEGYELYADGERVGGVGSLARPPDWPGRNSTVFTLPPEVLRDGEVVLTLRSVMRESLRSQPGELVLPRLADGVYVLGEEQAVQALVKADEQRRVVHFISPTLTICFGILVLGLYFLWMHRQRRDLRYLSFGLICLSCGLALPIEPLIALGSLPPLLHLTVYPALILLAMAAAPPFVRSFLEQELRLSDKILMGLGVTLACLRLLLPIGLRGWLPGGIDDVFLLLCDTWYTGVVAIAAFRGDRRARLMAAASLLVVGGIVLGIADNQGLVPGLREAGLPPPFLLGFGAFMTVMALLLGRSFVDDLALAHRSLKRTHQATRRFVPYEFLDLLGRTSIDEIDQGDQVTIDMSVMFADVRSFTSISEGMEPQQVFDLINGLLQDVVPAVHRHGGFVDKYMGDGVMVLFPTADQALDGALALQQAVREHNLERARSEGEPIELGIGVHSGPLTLGTLGSSERLSCTVIGDNVNIAARLEELTRTYGCDLLISGETRAALSRHERLDVVRLDTVQLRGKQKSVDVYRVVGRAA